MKAIKRYIKDLKENLSLIPIRTVELPTGLIVDHYKNGSIIANKRRNAYGDIKRLD